MHDMMKPLNIMRDYLIVANECASSNFTTDDSQRFHNETRKHEKWLHQMYTPTKMMQASLRKLSDYRMDLDLLISEINENRIRPGHSLQGCSMMFDCIDPSSTKLKNVSFMAESKKIQNNPVTLMNDLEHNACSLLLISQGASILEAEDTNEVACYEVR